MIKAVIFDMYETLITQYSNPQYFGRHIAKDAGIEEAVLILTGNFPVNQC